MSSQGSDIVIKVSDKGRWISLGATLIICLCAGFGYSWSVVQSPIVSLYGWEAAKVSLTFTMTVIFSTLSPLLFSRYIKRLPVKLTIMLGALLYGGGLFATGFMTQLWHLYLFYGVFSGIGCGLIYPTMMAYSVRLFPDKSGMASGLATAFYGAGAILWAPIMVALSGVFSLKTAFVLLGTAFFGGIIIVSALLKEPGEVHSNPIAHANAAIQVEKGLCRKEMVRTGRFYMTVMAFSLGLTAGLIVISQASPILQQSLSFTPQKAAAFVSVFAACNMAGRFVWGSISDKIGITKSMYGIFVVCILVMGGLVVLSVPMVMLVCMGLAASCYGGLASLLTPLTANLFGRKYITENYGVMYVVFGIASLLAPNLAIYFVGNSGSYSGAYLTAGIFAVIGLGLSMVLNKKTNN